MSTTHPRSTYRETFEALLVAGLFLLFVNTWVFRTFFIPSGSMENTLLVKDRILVDELTASASECFAGALQSLGRARIFGRQTMGQALPASTKQLPNGDVLLHVVGDFVTSNGKSLEGDGVIPDELVPLDRVALAAGRDPAEVRALAGTLLAALARSLDGHPERRAGLLGRFQPGLRLS